MERVTFSTEGKKFISGKISADEFKAFFENFKSGLKSLKAEMEKTVSPALYFNDGSKKVTEKNEAFKSICDDIDRGVRIVDSALLLNSMDKFKKGYATITAAGDRMENLHKEVSSLANSISM
ncbi:MAG: hypothetical protein MJ234_00485 [bacterium]|nr:hypothetical protein [bacterium]